MTANHRQRIVHQDGDVICVQARVRVRDQRDERILPHEVPEDRNLLFAEMRGLYIYPRRPAKAASISRFASGDGGTSGNRGGPP